MFHYSNFTKWCKAEYRHVHSFPIFMFLSEVGISYIYFIIVINSVLTMRCQTPDYGIKASRDLRPSLRITLSSNAIAPRYKLFQEYTHSWLAMSTLKSSLTGCQNFVLRKSCHIVHPRHSAADIVWPFQYYCGMDGVAGPRKSSYLYQLDAWHSLHLAQLATSPLERPLEAGG